MSDLKSNESQWKRIYIVGGIAAILSLAAVLLDIFIGSAMGGNPSELPQTAVERFAQFQQNAWLGLYNLDLLNTVNQLISIPVYFALYATLRKTNFAIFFLMVVALTIIFTWVYNYTQGSIFIASLVHTAIDAPQFVWVSLFLTVGQTNSAEGEAGLNLASLILTRGRLVYQSNLEQP